MEECVQPEEAETGCAVGAKHGLKNVRVERTAALVNGNLLFYNMYRREPGRPRL